MLNFLGPSMVDMGRSSALTAEELKTAVIWMYTSALNSLSPGQQHGSRGPCDTFGHFNNTTIFDLHLC